nr:MAG TPA: hypothetical protein [Bacteriophage sp.]DAO57375.1 MAG TPA: hypothetical protein [Caudoviricetes sp.]
MKIKNYRGRRGHGDFCQRTARNNEKFRVFCVFC